jgi:hypothetical protein
MSANSTIRPSGTARGITVLLVSGVVGGCSPIYVGGGMRRRMRRDQGLSGRRGPVRIGYGEHARCVERFAGALYESGVRWWRRS